MNRSTYIDVKHNQDAIRLSAKLRLASDHLVVFLHGLGCAKECFEAAFSFKELRDLSICTFDFPGHGRSMRSGISSYSLQSYADITNSLIQRIPHTTVSLVCHSMGGAVGLIVTQERKDLRTFISVEGNLVAQDCGIVSRNTANQSLRNFKRKGFKGFLERLQTSQDADDKAWAKWYAKSDPSALHESASSLVEWSDSGKLLDLFRSLRDKAYVYGEDESKSYLLPELTGLTSCAVPRAGHFVMLDNPESFYSLLAQLLHRPEDATAVQKTNIVDLARI